jgi:hypothetical protein
MTKRLRTTAWSPRPLARRKSCDPVRNTCRLPTDRVGHLPVFSIAPLHTPWLG